MSKFTITVLQIVKNIANDNKLTIYEQINKASPLIFNLNYPIWNENYRVVLESKILSRYLNKEICYDNYAMWQFKICERLNSIMPYYNQLYTTTLGGYDYTKDYASEENTSSIINGKDIVQGTDTTHSTSLDNNTTSSTASGVNNISTINNASDTNTASNTTANTNIMSDVPQVHLGVTDYASGITQDNGTSTGTNTGTSTSSTSTSGTDSNTGASTLTGQSENTIDNEKDVITDRSQQETSSKITKGNNRSIQELTMLQRETFINLDNLIVNELSDLFINYYEGR